MPRRALDNPLVEAVLGLLLERPMHPYQLLVELRRRGKDTAVRVNRGSLYNIVETVEREGWIAPKAHERGGNRPERTVYALTGTGRQELERRLDSQIRTPRREFPQFLSAISYLGALGRTGAAHALEERADGLRELVEHDEQRLAETLSEGTPRLFVIEAEYALHMLRSELTWVGDLAEQVRTEQLPWPADHTEPPIRSQERDTP